MTCTHMHIGFKHVSLFNIVSDMTVATPNTQSAHNVYMEVLVDKYFDQTTSKLQVTGLEQMMTNLGLAGMRSLGFMKYLSGKL